MRRPAKICEFPIMRVEWSTDAAEFAQVAITTAGVEADLTGELRGITIG